MPSIDELREFTAARATPPQRQKAFEEGMINLYRTYPDRWVLYTALWNEETGRYDFVVHGVFETQKEAVDSTLTLSAKERGLRTLISTKPFRPGIRIGSLGW